MTHRTIVVDGNPMLRGGRCEPCGYVTVPYRVVCPRCRQQKVIEDAVDAAGTVEHITDVQIPIESIDAPYAIALVRIQSGQQLLARLVGTAQKGDSVLLDVDAESDAYWFRSAE